MPNLSVLKRYEVFNDNTIESIQLCYALDYGDDFHNKIWKGNKAKEMPHMRKEFEYDIAKLLDSTYFRRAY